MRRLPAPVLALAAALISLATAGCVTNAPPNAGFGVPADHLGYVPARIAILPCAPWPNGARYKDQPLSTVKAADVDNLCAAMDAFVVAGFNNQPYMKGWSPKAVLKALADAKQPALLSDLPQIWAHTADDCATCPSAPAFYQASIAKRTAWTTWLNTLSKAARNADAVLLPFITYGYERRYSDRGLTVEERAAGVVMLLVDTNNGDLLWAGGRDAAVPNKRLEGGNVAGPLAPPSWTEVEQRLLVEDLWRDFPGRQIF